jgi:hypothetical protein
MRGNCHQTARDKKARQIPSRLFQAPQRFSPFASGLALRRGWGIRDISAAALPLQGLTGAKIDYHSIPYRNIIHFSIETSGHFDLDAELKIYLSGGTLIAKRFSKKLNIYEVQSVLANYILK